jgi:hypothetical protein
VLRCGPTWGARSGAGAGAARIGPSVTVRASCPRRATPTNTAPQQTVAVTFAAIAPPAIVPPAAPPPPTAAPPPAATPDPTPPRPSSYDGPRVRAERVQRPVDPHELCLEARASRAVAEVPARADQQRTAILMNAVKGMRYAEIAGALGISEPAVKAVLNRARRGLNAAEEARSASCRDIRAELERAHDRKVRMSGREPRDVGHDEAEALGALGLGGRIAVRRARHVVHVARRRRRPPDLVDAVAGRPSEAAKDDADRRVCAATAPG